MAVHLLFVGRMTSKFDNQSAALEDKKGLTVFKLGHKTVTSPLVLEPPYVNQIKMIRLTDFFTGQMAIYCNMWTNEKSCISGDLKYSLATMGSLHFLADFV